MMFSLLVLRTAVRRSLGRKYSYCQLKTETGLHFQLTTLSRRRCQAITRVGM